MWPLKNPFRLTNNIMESFIKLNSILWVIVLPHAHMIRKLNFMTWDLSMSFRFTRDMRDLSSPLISIPTVHIWSHHLRMVQQKSGILKKGSFNTPFKPIQTTPHSAVKVTISSVEVHRSQLIFGNVGFMTQWRRTYFPAKPPSAIWIIAGKS